MGVSTLAKNASGRFLLNIRDFACAVRFLSRETATAVRVRLNSIHARTQYKTSPAAMSCRKKGAGCLASALGFLLPESSRVCRSSQKCTLLSVARRASRLSNLFDLILDFRHHARGQRRVG